MEEIEHAVVYVSTLDPEFMALFSQSFDAFQALPSVLFRKIIQPILDRNFLIGSPKEYDLDLWHPFKLLIYFINDFVRKVKA